MGTFVGIIWLFLVIATPIAFVVSAYAAYVENKGKGMILGSFALSLLIYLGFTALSAFPVFIAMFASAHSAGSDVLEWKPAAFYLGLLGVFVLLGWALSSFIYQGVIVSWKIFAFSFRKTPSIFENHVK